MFTGIIIDVGEVERIGGEGDRRARIACASEVADAPIGASIACDGVCLTVVARGGGGGERPWFEVDVSAETLARSNLSRWEKGRRVNLERALKVGDELGGHIVAGHVDGLAEIVSAAPEGDSVRLRLRAPGELARYVAPKGSVALNGVSLTVNEVVGPEFGVNVIPHTRAVTNLGEAAAGDRLNLEIDTLARYVARLREWES